MTTETSSLTSFLKDWVVMSREMTKPIDITLQFVSSKLRHLNKRKLKKALKIIPKTVVSDCHPVATGVDYDSVTPFTYECFMEFKDDKRISIHTEYKQG